MVLQQKEAVFNIAVCVATLALYVVLRLIIGPYQSHAAFSLLALHAISALIYRKVARKGDVTMDERDLAIRHKAAITGFGIFWLFFVGFSLAAFYANQQTGMVSVNLWVLMVFIGWIVLYLAWSIAALVLYR
jgi:hypothetical protein